MSFRYLLRRLGGALLVIFLTSIVVAMMVHLVPGDAASAIAGDDPTPDQIAEIRERLGLDRPILVQYFDWAADAIRGDFRASIVNGRSVTELIVEASPATLSITLAAAFVAIVIGISFGAVAGLRRGGTDRVASIVTSLGIAMPSFWVGMLLVSVFALEFGWLPATSYVPLTESPVTWLRHITLPAIALGVAMAAEIARQTRGGVIEVMAQPYIRTARAKGVPGARLVGRHVSRNAAIPVVTVLGLQLGRLLGGVIVVEQVFGVAGLGTLAVSAVGNRDFPVIQAYVVMTAVVVVTLNLLVDLSYSWINPKVRSE